MESLLGALLELLVLILVIALAIYIATAIFLNKFNKLVYGKGTAMAWIPIFNVYLLGKLAVNKAVGWILVICVFLTTETTVTFNDVETTYSILPERIRTVVYTIYTLAYFGLLIYAIVKYNKLKKEKNNTNQFATAQYAQPIQPEMNYQQPPVQQNFDNNQINNQNPTNHGN